LEVAHPVAADVRRQRRAHDRVAGRPVAGHDELRPLRHAGGDRRVEEHEVQRVQLGLVVVTEVLAPGAADGHLLVQERLQ